MDAIENFKTITDGIGHGTTTFYHHSKDVYDFLKRESLPEDVCLAGLYHAIYGTNYFYKNLHKIKVEITRDYIKNVIGEFAENLVYQFCSLPNRDVTIYNGSDIYLQYIAYANLLAQSRPNKKVEKLKILYKNKLSHREDIS